jgi:hypothetical protein
MPRAAPKESAFPHIEISEQPGEGFESAEIILPDSAMVEEMSGLERRDDKAEW